MIVQCAYCGPLPAADLEALGEKAWGKHVVQIHPEWPIAMVVPMDSLWFEDPAQRDGDGCGADPHTTP